MKLVNTLLIMMLPIFGLSQTLKIGGDLTVVHFNAAWNSANDVKWFGDLTDVKIKNCDIASDVNAQSKYEIAVVPTIIIFKDGEEEKRFQADISFTMKATKNDVQEAIDEIIMGDF